MVESQKLKRQQNFLYISPEKFEQAIIVQYQTSRRR